MKPVVISLFSGIGGLDLGFKQAGFEIKWANDNEPSTWATYRANHPETTLDQRDIAIIPSAEIPDCDIVIGGPPCQSWSAAGSNRGASDPRGKLFYEYLRVIRDKQPKIFVAENVEGITRKTHREEFQKILTAMTSLGYTVDFKLLNSADYGVPQDRKRVIIVGLKGSTKFQFPTEIATKISLKQALEGIAPSEAKPFRRTDVCTDWSGYLDDSWSSQFMSRNRVRSWNEVSFTIPATGRQVPLHPQAPKMIKVDRDKFEFDGDRRDLYRRLTVHECARIQTFPDSFRLVFNRIEQGYKMIGNAVPVRLAFHIASAIMSGK